MGTDSDERIVISREELADRKVDEVLQQQLSFGMAAAPERVTDKKTSVIYRAWFALMIAGALGALCGWGLIEPFFDDGLRFHGNLRRVDACEMVGQLKTSSCLDVSGTLVWLVGGVTRIRRGRQTIEPGELIPGQVVDVVGNVFGEKPTMGVIASEVAVIAEEGGDIPRADLSSLSLRQHVAGLSVFPLIAALVGLFIGAADGLLSRAPRRSAICGMVGLGVGLGLGLIAAVLAELVYALGTAAVHAVDSGERSQMSTPAFLVQMTSRGIAWSIAGAAMGLGQGVALRSRKLLINGLLGGMVGALLGGLLFDPVDFVIHGGRLSGGAEVSRAVGFAVIGLATGLMIGIVELIAREAWIKMLTGPLAGKEFVLYKNPTVIGSSPKADVYLFKDLEVEPTHALVHALGEGYEIEDKKSGAGTFVNGRRVSRWRLADGDQVRIGKTVFGVSLKEA